MGHLKLKRAMKDTGGISKVEGYSANTGFFTGELFSSYELMLF
jgi:hypothetical protein